VSKSDSTNKASASVGSSPFVDLSCSGATTDDILYGGSGQLGIAVPVRRGGTRPVRYGSRRVGPPDEFDKSVHSHRTTGFQQEQPEHQALLAGAEIDWRVGGVRLDRAEAVETATSTWRQAGPMRVRGELSARLGELASQGFLTVDDPDRAALHLMLLVSAGLPARSGAAPTQHEITEAVTSGVRAFLHGYGT